METNSMTLLSIASTLENAESLAGQRVQEENDRYEFLTQGEGKFQRKLTTSEQQTVAYINTSDSTLRTKYTRRNQWTWVTVWMLYDEEMGQGQPKRSIASAPVEEQLQLLGETDKLLNAGLVLDRILDNMVSRDLQLAYKANNRSDPNDLDAEFMYELEPLWTYMHDVTDRTTVSGLVVNPWNSDILAVGYGKYLYTEPDKGFVHIWNVKNLKYPEKTFRFESPVTCLSFAEKSPNVLAVACLDGSVTVLDVSAFRKKVLYRKHSISCKTYDSVLFIKWWIVIDIFGGEEELLILAVADGRVLQFRRDQDQLVPFQMIRISKLEGKVKGLKSLGQCNVEEVPVERNPCARAVVRYPLDPQTYLVSADDGSIHKCSVNFFSEHMDVFLAHAGPVNAIKFSPVCPKILATCGADGAVRIWAWDVTEPLLTLTVGPSPVQDIDWSPCNSTILVSITGPCIHLWDLRRKTYHPASTTYHHTNINYSTVMFTPLGDNLLLGDMEGNVQVMALSKMPFDQTYKEDVLAACIEKELIIKPKLLKMLRQVGPPFTPLDVADEENKQEQQLQHQPKLLRTAQVEEAKPVLQGSKQSLTQD